MRTCANQLMAVTEVGQVFARFRCGQQVAPGMGVQMCCRCLVALSHHAMETPGGFHCMLVTLADTYAKEWKS